MWPFRRRFPRTEILELGPNDLVVIESRERLRVQDAEYMRELFAEWSGLEKKRVAVIYNASVKVVRDVVA